MTVYKKNFDKFYTHPDIAEKFIHKINEIVDLSAFDLVIEPSAGSGNILQFLPDNKVGLDLHPESPEILKQDFFQYQPPNVPTIAVVGNPPFGVGYMNPLAKAFFNHAAMWADIICFIVPAKWHSSWKVHSALNKEFGLYFSEILPKNSFVFDGKLCDVNCCMQIWSRTSLGQNLRFLTRPATSHPDFDFFLTCDNVKRRPEVRNQISKSEYWEFGLKYWGKIEICEMPSVPVNTTTHYVFKSHKPYVREIFESICWNNYVTNMGAPNVGGKSIIIKAYTERKKELGYIEDPIPAEKINNPLFSLN
jgi:hypothetical protein